MLTLQDTILVTNPLLLDAFLTNYYVIDNAIKIETIEEYLIRVPRPLRKRNVPILFILDDGYIALGDFADFQNICTLKYYIFKDGVDDEDLIPYTGFNSDISITWHPDGIIFSGDSSNSHGIVYTDGTIFIYDQNNDSIRNWKVTGNIDDDISYILDTLDTHYIFVKVPLSESEDTAEIIITTILEYENTYIGYTYILMGIINFAKGKLVFSMLWGNDSYLPKPVIPIETREVIDSEECLKQNDLNTGVKKTYFHTETKDNKTLEWILNEDPQTRETNDYTTCPIPTIDTREIIDKEECVKVDDLNIGMKRTYFHTESKNSDTFLWISNEDPQTRDSADYTMCPLPIFSIQWLNDPSKDYCEKVDGFNNGTLYKYMYEQSKKDNGDWVNTDNTRYDPTYNTTTCPITLAVIHISTGNYDDGYNFTNEIHEPFRKGSIFINAPIYNDPSGEDGYLYLSIPNGTSFVLTNVIGIPITTSLSSIGADNRTDFKPNTLYRLDDSFATNYGGMFNLIIS